MRSREAAAAPQPLGEGAVASALLSWLGKPGNPRAWSQESGWLQRGALGTRNETGSWERLLFIAALEHPSLALDGAWLQECQRGSSGSAVWSLSPGWDCVQPKQSPSSRNFCCLGKQHSGLGCPRLTTGSVSGTVSHFRMPRSLFNTTSQPGSAFPGSFSVWDAASSRDSSPSPVLTQGHQSRC